MTDLATFEATYEEDIDWLPHQKIGSGRTCILSSRHPAAPSCGERESGRVLHRGKSEEPNIRTVRLAASGGISIGPVPLSTHGATNKGPGLATRPVDRF